MLGDGIDMYDLVEVSNRDPSMIFTGKKFWVGVIEQMYPSPPIPRTRTSCFSAAPVYIYEDQYLFGMKERLDQNTFVESFYLIPEREKKFVQ